jgi:Flp pilus assembly protein TadD
MIDTRDIKERSSGRRSRRRLPHWYLSVLLLVAAGCSATGSDVKQVTTPTPAVSGEALLTAAEADIEARRFQLAYQRLARLDPAMLATPRAQLASGEVLLGLGESKQALAQFQVVQSDEAYRARAYQGMALSLMALDDFSAAKTQLDQAVAADPDLWRSWMALGRVYDGNKNWAEAESAYAKALATQPKSPIVVNNIGMSLMMQHRYPEAAEAFKRALAADPTMEMTRTNLRIALAWQGQYDEALVGTRAAGRADALNNVGYVAMLRGDSQTAQKYFSQALELSPTYHERAARNLETLKLLLKSRAPDQMGQATGAPPQPVN